MRNAKSLLAISLVKVLQTLETQLREYRRRITETFAQHPDHDVFGSLPGAAAKIAPEDDEEEAGPEAAQGGGEVQDEASGSEPVDGS